MSDTTPKKEWWKNIDMPITTESNTPEVEDEFGERITDTNKMRHYADMTPAKKKRLKDIWVDAELNKLAHHLDTLIADEPTENAYKFSGAGSFGKAKALKAGLRERFVGFDFGAVCHAYFFAYKGRMICWRTDTVRIAKSSHLPSFDDLRRTFNVIAGNEDMNLGDSDSVYG